MQEINNPMYISTTCAVWFPGIFTGVEESDEKFSDRENIGLVLVKESWYAFLFSTIEIECMSYFQ